MKTLHEFHNPFSPYNTYVYMVKSQTIKWTGNDMKKLICHLHFL